MTLKSKEQEFIIELREYEVQFNQDTSYMNTNNLHSFCWDWNFYPISNTKRPVNSSIGF